MYDNSLHFSDVAEDKAPLGGILRKIFENGYRRLSAADRAGEWHLKQGEYILATIHRDNNTDYPERLNAIFRALADIAEGTAGERVLLLSFLCTPVPRKCWRKLWILCSMRGLSD